MARYTQTINSLTSSRTDINQALSEKLEDTFDVKFSEMGDKIREIETGKAIEFEILTLHPADNTDTFYVEFTSDTKTIRYQYNDFELTPGNHNLNDRLKVSAKLSVGNWNIHIFYEGSDYEAHIHVYEGDIEVNGQDIDYDYLSNSFKTKTSIRINETTTRIYIQTQSGGSVDIPIDPPEIFD